MIRGQRARSGVARQKPPPNIPLSVEQWLTGIQQDPRLDAPTKAIAEVMARHARPAPGGGFQFEETEEAKEAMLRAVAPWAERLLDEGGS